VSNFTETLKQLGPARLAVMAAILLSMLLFFVFVSLRVSTPEMKLLYGDLSSTDSGAIAAKLEESKITYDVSADGARITVPSPDVGKARILLAEAGLPNGGSLGYELFDKQSGFGTTNFVQNINQVRALEGELSRTISAIQNVRSARVHLVLPQRELFAKEARPSSASVYLGIRPGGRLEKENIYAIQSLVASAVPDLKSTNVTIIDNAGNLLANGSGSDDEATLMAAKTEDMRRNYETRLTGKIEDQVSRIVGFGNVRAIVTAEMNFDRISTNEEVFDPASQVVRSNQTTSENSLEREPNPEDVSVKNNLPGVGGNLLTDKKPSAENNKTEEVTNFEISKTVRSTVREMGEIKHLSLAILVNGQYVKDKDGKQTYKERTPDELKQIEELVKSAAGYDEKRGDTVTVKNIQFAAVDTNEDIADDSMLFGFQKSELINAAEVLLIGIMVVLVVLLVLQPMVTRLLAPEEKDVADDLAAQDLLGMRAMNPALSGPTGDDYIPDEPTDEESLISIHGVEGKVKSSSIKRVEEIVENYPAETVSVIRSWMTQEN